jgi:hypothetical protein
MSIFQDIASEIGLPTGATALAVGLVRGAKALETDANPRALRYVSDLLTEGDLKNIGKAGAGLVPFVFDKIFGSRPLSFRFITRSIIATSLFWIVLLLLRHADWKTQITRILDVWGVAMISIPLFYALDFLSLLKAKSLLPMISERYAIITSFCFLCIDIIFSYTLAFVALTIAGILYGFFYKHFSFTYAFSILKLVFGHYFEFGVVLSYFSKPAKEVILSDVIVPSTMLTSVWTFLLFVSCLIAQLLVPIDYLRRFTTFWFKDVEHHPLTAIAKVAATLIVIGAFAIKAVRWIY